MRLISILLIFGGECIGIFLEIFVANKFRHGEPFMKMLASLFLLTPFFILAFLFLLTGYIYGFRSYHKIWAITAISWSSIVLIEPVLNYAIFRETPSGTALVAVVFAFTAIALSVFG